ncbi:MAG TPA: hypothetical protein VH351_10845 [Bryobacteraceae bacterium]|jgi:hypothetical protein|nr:hypothetical protein [Bryobacteraceae bacterium]
MSLVSVVVAILTALLGLIAGLTLETFKQWVASWWTTHVIRKATQAEIMSVLIELNFYVLAATEEGPNEGVDAKYLSHPLSLESFEYYWQDQRDALLKLPEWCRLKNWNTLLGQIRNSPRPPLFNVIMLFESFTIGPLDKCLSRESMAFVRSVLDRPEVQQYRNNYFHAIAMAVQ